MARAVQHSDKNFGYGEPEATTHYERLITSKVTLRGVVSTFPAAWNPELHNIRDVVERPHRREKLVSSPACGCNFRKNNLYEVIFTKKYSLGFKPNDRPARLLRSDRARAKARSLRSDRVIVPLGRYVATELSQDRPARSLRSDRARAKARSLRSDRAIVPLGRYVATELEPKIGRYVATERSSRSRPRDRPARSLRSDRARAKARSLRSDRAIVLLGCYVATELKPKIGRYVATEHSFRSRLNLSEHRYDTSPCILKPRKTRSKRLEPEDGPKGPKTRLEAHPTIFPNQKPVNHSMVRAWPTRKDKCQVSADKYGSFEDNCEDRENGISPFLCYDGLRAEDCDSIRFSRLRVARTRNLADSSRAQAYTLL
ncbi:hypothetical protein IGI04_023138 [Brassica rapa subsp. trilocularis]|uniref:Uncharacterized protein n=1 Tax=Brassica rapa subsp. trilocularis TaxID=1813537 RepID=A0ABQ7M5K1_BRACM|nr:hypothetical protein IGI04_023138 [Brassica rapa subsp. trilocularis]